MRARRSLLCVSLVISLCGCASTTEVLVHRNLKKVWREYRQVPDERALAIVGDPRKPGWVTTASGGHSTLEEAQASALAQCRVRRQRRRIQAKCVLYAIGNQIVWRRR